MRSPQDGDSEATGGAADGPDVLHDRSLRHLVEAHILGELKAGRLRPGDRLLEGELARTLRVSVTPVREALFRLVHDGIIVHPPRRGFFIAELGADEVEEVYSFRALVEGLAASWAALRVTPAQLAELEGLIAEGETAGREGDTLRNVECNAAFHALIITAARHQLATRAWRMLGPMARLTPVSRPPTSAAEVEDWGARHRRLLDAIRSGDAQRAEREARAHVERAAAGALRRLRSEGGPVPATAGQAPGIASRAGEEGEAGR